MIFGRVPLAEAAGAILAHGLKGAGYVYAKGRILNADDLAVLATAGLTEVVVARFEPGDVGEDAAAATIARLLAGDGVVAAAATTGRANLFATAAGLLRLDADRITALNRVTEAITVATLAPQAPVAVGQMLATVKIIPFAVPAASLADAAGIAREGARDGKGAALAVAPYQPLAAGLIQTRLAGGPKPSVLAKTEATVAARLAALGGHLAAETVVGHGEADVAAAIDRQRAAGCDPILVLGASAITDRADVVPAAIAALGGRIVHLGMPVDPGNLLLLAELGEARIIGVPGCARSPARNGFDLVLERLAAGLAVTGSDLMAMGVGGLMLEVAPRPLPRAAASPPPVLPVAGVILAAGRGRRFTTGDKLAQPVSGQPLLRWPIEAALAAGLDPVVVVLGHAADRLRPLIADLPVTLLDNPGYRDGLATSLQAGLAALPAGCAGAVVLLADMPLVAARHLQALLATFTAADRRAVVVPVAAGRRGNPVVWPRALFPALARLTGDAGVRSLLAAAGGDPLRGEAGEAIPVVEVAMPDDAILVDIDDAAALARLTG
jgi:molybdenum cofactor cytidylyltransferase